MMNIIKRVLLLFALLCGMTTVWGQTESKNMNYKKKIVWNRNFVRVAACRSQMMC
jgi:hypothetical protein